MASEEREFWNTIFSRSVPHEPSLSSNFKYGSTAGLAELRRSIADYFIRQFAWDIGVENVLVGVGAQSICFSSVLSFCDPQRSGLVVNAVEYAGYQSFQNHAKFMSAMPSSVVKEKGKRFRYEVNVSDESNWYQMNDVGLVLISEPNNPTGGCLNETEWARVFELADRNDCPILVDRAYGAPFPKLGDQKVDTFAHPNVINVFSLSKLGIPGIRLGIAIADAAIIESIAVSMSSFALHAPIVSQNIGLELFNSGSIDRFVGEVVQPKYRRHQQLTQRLLERFFPDNLDWQQFSEGNGMYAWVWINEERFDAMRFFEFSLDRGVAIAPGPIFSIGETDANTDWHNHLSKCIRITSSVEESSLEAGVKQLADALKAFLSNGH